MIAQETSYGISYFKRFRMEVDVQVPLPAVPELPAGYEWVPWEECLLDVHAEVKFQCFVEEVDSRIFSSLSNREGCRRLMREISAQAGFKPEATWMIACDDAYCATVQGLRERSGLGAIQNVGVTPEHRGRGLGRALMLQSLHGFQRCGVHRVHLEVTASNDPAIRLYRRLGFRCRKTIYKAVQEERVMQLS